ncbi:MAG TPA: lactate dehydrogenase [Candidatus Latescibacteria bacterium]|nr:lactate dehydrogenase [Candidatus Latescibacterota bacterium]
MKVVIVGGAGRVGSNTAFALQLGGVVQEVGLVDVAEDAARGEALDLLHGSAFVASQRFYAGGYELVPEADLVIITAGLRRRPDESRLALINRNVALFREVLGRAKEVGWKEGAVLLVVTNPVDVLTYLGVRESGLPPERVFGLGTMLDTTRFRSLLAEHFGVDPTQVDALILGEHGDSMVPIWSTATVNGVPLKNMPGYSEAAVQKIFERTKGSGAEMIRLKGGAGYAVGVAVREVVHAMSLDRKAVLPVSSLLQGAYDIRQVCLSVPTVVGRFGVEGHVEMELWPKELSGLQRSAEVLRETIGKVL